MKGLKVNGYQLFGYSTEKLEAFLARLEAAERALNHFWVVHERGFKKQGCQNCEKSVEKWRKRAGK